MRADVDDHPIAAKHARAAVVQAHLNRLGRDKTARAPMMSSAPLALEVVEMHGYEAVHHLPLAPPDLGHVGGDRAGRRAKAIGVADQVGDLGAPDLVLARQAVGVRAGPADQLAFDDGDVRCPDLGQVCQATYLPPSPLPRTSRSKVPGWDISTPRRSRASALLNVFQVYAINSTGEVIVHRRAAASSSGRSAARSSIAQYLTVSWPRAAARLQTASSLRCHPAPSIAFLG